MWRFHFWGFFCFYSLKLFLHVMHAAGYIISLGGFIYIDLICSHRPSTPFVHRGQLRALGCSPCPGCQENHQDYYVSRLGDPELNLHLPLESWEGAISNICPSSQSMVQWKTNDLNGSKWIQMMVPNGEKHFFTANGPWLGWLEYLKKVAKINHTPQESAGALRIPINQSV